jgi:hypothetical protein
MTESEKLKRVLVFLFVLLSFCTSAFAVDLAKVYNVENFDTDGRAYVRNEHFVVDVWPDSHTFCVNSYWDDEMKELWTSDSILNVVALCTDDMYVILGMEKSDKTTKEALEIVYPKEAFSVNGRKYYYMSGDQTSGMYRTYTFVNGDEKLFFAIVWYNPKNIRETKAIDYLKLSLKSVMFF